MRKNTSSHMAVALLIIAGCFLYVWQAIIPKYQANKTELLAVSAELSSARAKLQSLQTAQGSLSQLGKYADMIFVSMPDSADTPNLLAELEAIATKHQTFMPSIQISDPSASSATASTSALSTGAVGTSTNGNAIPVAFTVDGSFEELSQFISSLENDVRFMNIKTISITSGKDKMSLAVQLDVYKRSNESLSSSTASSVPSVSTGPTASSSSSMEATP